MNFAETQYSTIHLGVLCVYVAQHGTFKRKPEILRYQILLKICYRNKSVRHTILQTKDQMKKKIKKKLVVCVLNYRMRVMLFFIVINLKWPMTAKKAHQEPVSYKMK